MDNELEDGLKNLIQKSGPEKPSADFTGRIMKAVQVASTQEHAAMANLLKSQVFIEKPGRDFSRNVMAQITPRPLARPQAIISRNAWYMIAAGITLTMIFCIFMISPETVVAEPKTDPFLYRAVSGLESVPPIYSISLFAVSLLILADYYLRQSFGGRALRI